MDNESKELLRKLIDAQKEQTELLRRHVLPLWTRIRFSLFALFVLMTLMATGVGFTVLAIRSMSASAPTRQPAIITWGAPNGSLQLGPAPISVGEATANELRFSGSTSGRAQEPR